jgi:hypothetical protein
MLILKAIIHLITNQLSPLAADISFSRAFFFTHVQRELHPYMNYELHGLSISQ